MYNPNKMRFVEEEEEKKTFCIIVPVNFHFMLIWMNLKEPGFQPQQGNSRATAGQQQVITQIRQ